MILTQKPQLILVRGLPGSGKSYVVSALAAAIGSDKVAVLDPDAIDVDSDSYKTLCRELRAQGVDEKLYHYRYLRGRAHTAIEAGKVIIWNQAFTNRYIFYRTILNLQKHAEQHDVVLPFLVVEVSVDLDTAKQRVAQRKTDGGHEVEPAEMTRFVQDYESFSDQYDNLVQLDGEAAVESSVGQITEALGQLEYVRVPEEFESL